MRRAGSEVTCLQVLALTELRLRDWWRVLFQELRAAISLGAWL
jgi:hypothetical protein